MSGFIICLQFTADGLLILVTEEVALVASSQVVAIALLASLQLSDRTFTYFSLQAAPT